MPTQRVPLNNNYGIQIINNFATFAKSKTQWDDLSLLQGSNMPFLTHDWFTLWLRHFSTNNELLIILLWKNDELLCIAPLMMTHSDYHSIKTTKIQLIGNAYSPIRNFIYRHSDTRQRSRCLFYILTYLLRRIRGWDFIDLSPFPEQDGTLLTLQYVLQSLKLYHTKLTDSAKWYVTNINFSGTEYLDRLPKNVGSEMRRRRRRLQELGKVEFRIITSPTAIDEYMQHYYSVYARSWKKKEKIGPTFHRDLAKLAAQKGWLRLAFLFLNNRPIASQFRIVYRDTCFFLKTAYDLKYKKYAPGTILLADFLKYVIDVDQVTHIDFGPGDEPYKSVWASHKKELLKLLIFNRNVKGLFLALLKLNLSPIIQRHEKLQRMRNLIKTLSSKSF